MLFNPVIHDGQTIGFAAENDYAYFFFGTRAMPRENLTKAFPKYEFALLKQVHGRAVVDGDAGVIKEADAHFTSRRHLALISQTADCVPILLANEETVCAIHSGWRGTAQNITGAAKSAFPRTPPLTAAIGPHILRFEVGRDVAEKLLNASTVKEGLISPHTDPEKVYFNLTDMIRHQLREAFGAGIEIDECLFDTIRDQRFHSFRRDKQAAGRQYSFVVLKT